MCRMMEEGQSACHRVVPLAQHRVLWRCAGKLGPAVSLLNLGAVADQAHRGHVGSSRAAPVSKQEAGLGFHFSMFQQLSTARTPGKSQVWAQPGGEELPCSLLPSSGTSYTKLVPTPELNANT